jgi:hypothetical protein
MGNEGGMRLYGKGGSVRPYVVVSLGQEVVVCRVDVSGGRKMTE